MGTRFHDASVTMPASSRPGTHVPPSKLPGTSASLKPPGTNGGAPESRVPASTCPTPLSGGSTTSETQAVTTPHRASTRNRTAANPARHGS
ncbi:MAG: hypothetical protein DI536_13935 [Archangium gephyra]|uniref:Uncharacterized protein n=1 Tax=Archangium gephyra TaxID=48 RepID=A0A2W5TFH6_9BACT|nr:MAG: hypothetical protein DI536_13935 [Archangium gephyra]